MRLGIVTPFYFPSVRGNSITVQRIESGVRDQGVVVRVWSLENEISPGEILQALEEFTPDLVHGFHVSSSGQIVTDAAFRLDIPSILTVTGTDVNTDLFDPHRRTGVMNILQRATRIVVFHDVMRVKLVGELPEVEHRIRVIGQTVRCQETPFDLRQHLGLQPDDLIFCIPSGIRRIKDVTFCLKPLDALRIRYPQVKAVFVGPIIEAAEGVRLQELLRDYPWAFYLGPVPHEQVCAILTSVDVVINTSLSEGGMANSILEAMSCGRAVLARDIEGNRSVVQDGVDGLLFDSEAEFARKAERLISEPRLRYALGKSGKEKIEREFSREREIQNYLQLYQEAIGACPRRR
ncbi:glycosyl transferase family 1 [Candidatus Methylomirabilis limnetica]|uniref:Glycosyl transferase family 1 n=1 Tax=Candidatus Methylomirabilis limnetica TaxID=2033718 RepID=A0A2T4U143_9BACT|nr:glycosyltransferase [Candidatus Methylomirabilis limnetica]PTL37085.1 glycosyl transferase family 1 [Candidatus Methylomirabilis limnetica]